MSRPACRRLLWAVRGDWDRAHQCVRSDGRAVTATWCMPICIASEARHERHASGWYRRAGKSRLCDLRRCRTKWSLAGGGYAGALSLSILRRFNAITIIYATSVLAAAAKAGAGKSGQRRRTRRRQERALPPLSVAIRN